MATVEVDQKSIEHSKENPVGFGEESMSVDRSLGGVARRITLPRTESYFKSG